MRMLDLCCGGGLGGAGYWQSGSFSEIVGVDVVDMSAVYPFDFIQADALTLTYDFLLDFDFIHASPPCQFYSAITPRWARDNHPRLIPDFHLMLQAAGKPYVIENVPGSGHDLRPNLVLRGVFFGLPMNRPRLFHINQYPGSHHERVSSCSFSQMSGSAGANVCTRMNPHLSTGQLANMSLDRIFKVHEDSLTRAELITAFGLNSLPVSHLRRLTKDHIEQGIPPAMTKHIAQSMFAKFMIA